MTHRSSLATQFTGNYRHLKRNIKSFLKSKGVGHILQTTQLNDSEKLTSLYMEGESTVLYLVQTELVTHLQSIFPDICIQDWQEMSSDSPLFGSHIAPTIGTVSKDSSGFVEELEECSVQPEKPKWKDYFDSGFIQVVTAIQNGRQVAYEIRSSIESINEKFIHITYRTNTAHLNIGACILWPQLLQVIQECKILQIKKPIRGIYSLVDGKKSYESVWFGFNAEGHYYVETEDDFVQTFSSMEEFFEMLRTERKRPESDIEKVKAVFTEQAILFDDLIATGDLALTDEKLEKYGIAQGGLRTAILAVIKSNQ
jgi:hypothetical protein